MASRRTIRKSVARFTVTADQLPGVTFFQVAGLRENVADAITERRAIDAYRHDGIDEMLWETLRGLGWEAADIAAVARGAEIVTSYGSLPMCS
jgi:hypothetical protein